MCGCFIGNFLKEPSILYEKTTSEKFILFRFDFFGFFFVFSVNIFGLKNHMVVTDVVRKLQTPVKVLIHVQGFFYLLKTGTKK